MLLDRFANELANIQDPEVFLGVARILKVEMMDGDNPRNFYEMWADVIDRFNESPRKRKRELLRILREANICHGY